jgi:hypothetical protein
VNARDTAPSMFKFTKNIVEPVMLVIDPVVKVLKNQMFVTDVVVGGPYEVATTVYRGRVATDIRYCSKT